MSRTKPICRRDKIVWSLDDPLDVLVKHMLDIRRERNAPAAQLAALANSLLPDMPLTLDLGDAPSADVEEQVAIVELACQHVEEAGTISDAVAASWRIPELGSFTIELRGQEVAPRAVRSVGAAIVLLLRDQLPQVPPPARHWYVGEPSGLWDAH